MKDQDKKILMILSSFSIALLSVILLYQAHLGINFVLLNIILLFIINTVAKVFGRVKSSLFLNTLLLCLLSLPQFLTTSTVIRITSIITWWYLLVITMHTFVQKNEEFNLLVYIVAPIEQLMMAFVSPLMLIPKIKLTKYKYLSVFLRILIGIVISIPFLAIFLALLVSADLAFRDIVENVISTDFISHMLRIALWFAVVFWSSLGALYYNLYKKSEIKSKKEGKTNKKSRLIIESITVLSLVEILFLLFNAVQLTYLFGGESLIKSGEYTYSEYARRGFFELVAVSVIALLLIACISKIKKVKSAKQDMIFKSVALFGIFELIPISLSAFYKLYLYENAYGFTRLRVYSHIFIFYLLLLFVWFSLKFLTKIKESLFLYGFQLITVLSIVVVGIINVDAVIAGFNMKRYKEESCDPEKIDVRYLSTLSYDSAGEMIDLFKVSDGEVKEETAFYLESIYYNLKHEKENIDIREFNLRKELAFKELDDEINDIEIYSKYYEEKVINDIEIANREYFYPGDYCSLGQRRIAVYDSEGASVYVYRYSVMTLDQEIIIDDMAEHGCIDIKPGKYLLQTIKEFPLEKEQIIPFSVSGDEEIIYAVSRR